MIILAHDFETTGVDTAVCGVVQYAVAILELGQDAQGNVTVSVLEQHKNEVNPGHSIPEACTKVHGLTDADVADAVHWRTELKALYSLLFDAYPIEMVMGYNNRNYDDPIAYRAEMPRLPSFDLYDYGRHLKAQKQADNAKLTTVYQHVTGKELSGAHDAMVDISACVELIPQLAAMYGHSLAEMVDFATPNINPDALVGFGKHANVAIKNLPVGYANWVLDNSYKMPRDVVATLKALRAR